MWKPYYRRRFRRKEADPIEGIIGLCVLYLVFLYFTNKTLFWTLLGYAALFFVITIGIATLLVKFKNRKTNFNRSSNIEYANNSLNQNLNNNRSTPEARKLGDYISNFGWNVEPEKWDGHKHIDLAITKAKVNIEVDGRQHALNPVQAFRDQMRDYYSSRKGFETIRIPNSLLRDDESIRRQAELINKRLEDRVSRLRN